MRKLLRTPFGWIAIGAVGTLVPMVVPSGAGWPVSLAALCLYSVAAPLACAFGASWWLNTMLTGFAWVVILVAVGVMPGTKALREGAMVYMLPMMIYPVAGAVSALIRVVRWRKERTPTPPPVQV